MVIVMNTSVDLGEIIAAIENCCLVHYTRKRA